MPTTRAVLPPSAGARVRVAFGPTASRVLTLADAALLAAKATARAA
jgi:hypothetical protein